MIKKNRILSIVISLIMVCSVFGFMPMEVNAAMSETAGNSAELATAITNVDDGGTITLTADITYNTTLAIDSKNITINLGGNELTIDASALDNAVEIMNGGKLTVRNGVITAISHPNCTGLFVQYSLFECESDCAMDITGGSYGVLVDGSLATINGDVSATGMECNGVRVQGAAGKATINGDIKVNGAGSIGVYASGSGHIIINGGVEANGDNCQGVYSAMEGSVLTMTGNIITNGGESQGVVTFDNGIATVNGIVTVTGTNSPLTNTYGVRGLTCGDTTIIGNVIVNGVESIGVDAQNSGIVSVSGDVTANGAGSTGIDSGINSGWVIGNTAGGTVYITGVVSAINKVDIGGNHFPAPTKTNKILPAPYDGYYWDEYSDGKSNVYLRQGLIPPKYTVIFNSAGGSAVESKIYTAGTELGALPTTTRSGYTFQGWCDSADNKVSAKHIVTCDLTLTAKWKSETVKPKSSNASLKKINKSKGTFTKKFKETRYSYTLKLKKSQAKVKLTPVTADKNATLQIKSGSKWKTVKNKTVSVKKGKSKTIKFRVIAEDGKTIKTYKVIVKHAK